MMACQHAQMKAMAEAESPIDSTNPPAQPSSLRSSVIDCASVGKVFGKRTVLFNVDLSIRRGEKLAILGASGSGKTTLLRIMAGLETATSGRTLMNGQPVENITPAQRSIGMV